MMTIEHQVSLVWFTRPNCSICCLQTEKEKVSINEMCCFFCFPLFKKKKSSLSDVKRLHAVNPRSPLRCAAPSQRGTTSPTACCPSARCTRCSSAAAAAR